MFFLLGNPEIVIIFFVSTQPVLSFYLLSNTREFFVPQSGGKTSSSGGSPVITPDVDGMGKRREVLYRF